MVPCPECPFGYSPICKDCPAYTYKETPEKYPDDEYSGDEFLDNIEKEAKHDRFGNSFSNSRHLLRTRNSASMVFTPQNKERK